MFEQQSEEKLVGTNFVLKWNRNKKWLSVLTWDDWLYKKIFFELVSSAASAAPEFILRYHSSGGK
jgi:hypothetical protein